MSQSIHYKDFESTKFDGCVSHVNGSLYISCMLFRCTDNLSERPVVSGVDPL